MWNCIYKTTQAFTELTFYCLEFNQFAGSL